MKVKASLVGVAAPSSVMFGSALGLVTTLVTPRLLSSDEYITFATLLATGQLISIAGFEWLKQSVLRFGSPSSCSQHEVGERSRVLNGGYGFVTLVLSLIVAALVVLALVDTIAWLGAVALIYAISQGLFDGVQAWARSRLRNLRFATLWFIRAGLSLLVAVAVAATTGSGALCVAAIGICMLGCVTIACANARESRPQFLARRELRSLYPYFKFGFLAAMAASLTAAVQPLFRSMSGLTLGADGAAGAILAIDIAYKVMSIVGLSVNVLVSQRTYRQIDSANSELKPILEKVQFAFPLVLLVPAACLFYFAQPMTIALMAPATLQPAYMETIGYACFGGLASSVRLFCVDPLFLMARKARLALIAPICTLVLLASGAAFHFVVAGSISPRQLAAWYCMSTASGLAIAMFTARQKVGISVPWRQILVVSLAAIVLVYVMVLIKPNGLVETGVALFSAGIAYFGIVLISEASVLRGWVSSALAES